MGKERLTWPPLYRQHSEHVSSQTAVNTGAAQNEHAEDGRFFGGTGAFGVSKDTPVNHTGEAPKNPQVQLKNAEDYEPKNAAPSKTTLDRVRKTKKRKKKPRKKKGHELEGLRSKHDRLQALRDHVDARREEVQREYEDLDHRLSEVCSSQQELMNAFEEAFTNNSLEQDHEYLYNLWQASRSDIATWQARLSRIAQLMNLIVEPGAQLIVADGDFLDEAEKTMASLPTSKDKPTNALDPLHAKRETPTKTPTLLGRLSIRRQDVRMFNARLDELIDDTGEEQNEREFIRDRGDEPKVPDIRFFNRYEAARDQIERDLDQANADIVELERACIERGYITPPSAEQELSFTGNQSENVEGVLHGAVDHHKGSSSNGKAASEGTPLEVKWLSRELWSQSSLPGSLPNRDPNAWTEHWITRLQSESGAMNDSEIEYMPTASINPGLEDVEDGIFSGSDFA